jgi:hypothetical protein
MINKKHTRIKLSRDRVTYEVWESQDRITWRMVKWGLTLDQVKPIQEQVVLQNHINLLEDILNINE